MPVAGAGLVTGARQVERSQPRFVRWTALIAISILIAGGTVWAVATILTPPAAAPASPDATARVTRGGVEDAIALRITAEWTANLAGQNRAAGIVTRVDAQVAAQVRAGSILYRVDERPVFAATGTLPAYRDLSRGARGEDVRQLQGLLRDTGATHDAADGGFGARTEASVRRWQREQGLPVDGIVRTQDLIFMDRLPSRVQLDPAIHRGADLRGGEQAVRALADAPALSASVSASQAAAIHEGTAVQIDGPAGGMSAVTSTTTSRPDGSLALALVAPPGGTVCGGSCEHIPIGAPVPLTGRAITTPRREGLVIPLAALQTDAAGRSFVETTSGARVSVKVVASASGQAVVEGVREGVQVRIHAGADR